MIRLNSYQVTNFKNIKESEPLASNYLTILSGVNSGGKSSIVQPLLILKDLVLNKNSKEIDFTGMYVELGEYKDVANNPSKPISFKFSLTIEKDSENQNFFLDILDNVFMEYEKSDSHSVNKYHISVVKVDISLSFGKVNGKVRISKFHTVYRAGSYENYLLIENVNSKYRIQTSDFRSTFDKDFLKFVIERDYFEQDFLYNAKKGFEKYFSEKYAEFQVVFDNGLYPKLIHTGKKRNYYSPTLQINSLYNTILKEVLENFADNINYLGPLREEPKLNYYIRGNKRDDIGVKGENAPMIFYQHVPKTSHKFSEAPSETGEFSKERVPHTFSYFVNSWASYVLGTKIEFNVRKYGPQNYGLFQNKGDESHSMTNVGVGSSQLFPILVEGIRKRNGVLIIEQPELHLHPNAQARLADFLIAVSKSNYMKLLIETHSEHLINRLVRRIVRQEMFKKNVTIKFIDKSNIKDIKMNEIGIITEWPDGFFDTNLKEQENLYLDQKERFKANEISIDEL